MMMHHMAKPTGKPDRSRLVEMYDFDQSHPAPPMLPGQVVAAATVEELIDKLAADLVVHAENCVRQFGDFHLALSGGSTPVPLYERLMYDPNCRRLPWRRTHLWLVDERCVPFDHAQSNYRVIREIIVDHADIPQEQVHPISATSPTADIEYERAIRDALAWREKGQDRLDYVLLGMGVDGHTASMFPHCDAVREKHRLVVREVAGAAQPPERITMTLPLINSARLIGIMVTGASKASMIRRIATGNDAVQEIPVKGIAPISGELKWYLDAEACGGG
jgi:6-phosphogluconolactonase